MMKKSLLTAIALSTLITTPAFAQGGFQNPNAPQQMHHKGHQGGGFMNSTQAVSKVSEISSMKDDQFIVLQGNIVNQVGKDDFLFRDASGEITVEIERKAWQGQEITPADTVKLYGEVDKSWNKTEIDIKRVEKIK
ncbi:hypothetical protein A4G19_05835 [Pasteurellaceae bacterium Macca]|nr:hypothetical protein [Pasteurellaceae bacterium Macca]